MNAATWWFLPFSFAIIRYSKLATRAIIWQPSLHHWIHSVCFLSVFAHSSRKSGNVGVKAASRDERVGSRFTHRSIEITAAWRCTLISRRGKSEGKVRARAVRSARRGVSMPRRMDLQSRTPVRKERRRNCGACRELLLCASNEVYYCYGSGIFNDSLMRPHAPVPQAPSFHKFPIPRPRTPDSPTVTFGIPAEIWNFVSH